MRRPPARFPVLFTLTLALVPGCGGDGATPDQAVPADAALAANDGAPPDLAANPPDLAANPPDLGMSPGPDLAMAPPADLARLPDLAQSVDLAGADLGFPAGLPSRPANPTCLAPPRPVDNPDITFNIAFPNLTFTQPTVITTAPGDATRYFVAERRGVVRQFPNDPNANASAVFIDLSARVNSAVAVEAGLLGVAFHPDFARNGQVFLSYTGFANGGMPNLRSTLSRFTSRDGGRTLDPTSEEILLQHDPAGGNHHGGNIAFGPDGYLYIAFGDGSTGTGQNLQNWFGKMLRIDVNGAKPYAIPPGNPFANGGGKPEIWAYGLRNPWRWSFDAQTGDLWLGDVGATRLEEINRITKGGNYGWSLKEGSQCFPYINCANTPNLVDPVVEYGHGDGISVTGGYVYRGKAVPGLAGRYVYADFGTGALWSIDPTVMKPTPRLESLTGRAIASFGLTPDGELLFVEFNQGRVYQMTPVQNPMPVNFPQKLSQTGCVDRNDPRVLAPGVIPFDVNVELWSDGAQKQRAFAVPDGQQIAIGADGHFQFPIGSVLLKTFWLGGKRIETRLFARHQDGNWGGYSYEWDANETDATFVPLGRSRAVNNQTWTWPSRMACLVCHTQAAGRTLGPDVAQLDRDFTYPATGKTWNQMATLQYIGLFTAAPPMGIAAFPPINSNAPLANRARAYLHVNCSNCHRPGGQTPGQFDLRYTVPLAQTSTCNANPVLGNVGVQGARVLVPGDAAHSVIPLRMKDAYLYRMPPIGSVANDAGGINLVESWINSLAGCN